MEPTPETAEAIDELDPADDPGDLLPRLVDLAGRAQAIVPDLVGVSLSRLDEGLVFTLVATDLEVAVLDAVQYVAGGPCVEGAERVEVAGFDEDDVLDEARWQLFAEATAARSVRSTLTLPVVGSEGPHGSVNLYAGSRHAFDDLHEQLAGVFGAWAEGAVSNADLSFRTRHEAAATVDRLRDRAIVDTATGLLSAQLGIGLDDAAAHLRDAAARAGVPLVELARSLVEGRQRWDDAGRGPASP